MNGADLYAEVVGQPAAVSALRAAAADPVHAYLLVGPPGSGKRAAARAFAAHLLAGDPGDPDDRGRRLALAEAHPDLTVVERVGEFIDKEQAREIVRLSATSPVEGRRRVLVLDELHRVQDAAGVLLKAVEEPPPTTVFVILAEHVPPELVTVASRCVRVELGPVPPAEVARVLEAEGLGADAAATVAAAAGGDLRRARLLAADPNAVGRWEAWRDLPGRLDGTGETVAHLVDHVLALIDDAAAPLEARHADEVAELTERADRYGERFGARELERRHRRELRRHRTDELRTGLAALARTYRDALAGADVGVAGADVGRLLRATARISAAAEALARNPNEALWLQAVLLDLPPLGEARTEGRLVVAPE